MQQHPPGAGLEQAAQSVEHLLTQAVACARACEVHRHPAAAGGIISKQRCAAAARRASIQMYSRTLGYGRTVPPHSSAVRDVRCIVSVYENLRYALGVQNLLAWGHRPLKITADWGIDMLGHVRPTKLLLLFSIKKSPLHCTFHVSLGDSNTPNRVYYKPHPHFL